MSLIHLHQYVYIITNPPFFLKKLCPDLKCKSFVHKSTREIGLRAYYNTTKI